MSNVKFDRKFERAEKKRNRKKEQESRRAINMRLAGLI